MTTHTHALQKLIAAIAAVALLPAASTVPGTGDPTPPATVGSRDGVIVSASYQASLASRIEARLNTIEPLTIADLPLGVEIEAIIPDPLPAPAHEPSALADRETHFPQELADTEFVDSWGFPRDDGQRQHHGTDLMAPKMTSVYSLAAGTVIRLGEGRTSGRMLVIEHGNGYESWYMHLNNDAPGTDDGRASLEFTYAPGVAVGTVVAAGQLVGYVGDSGNAESGGPHTHFELHRHGTQINPFPTLLAAYRHDSLIAEDLERELRYWVLTELAE